MEDIPNPVGRPPKFTSPTDMQTTLEAFFKDCDDKGEPYTVTGLALALDTTRETLIDYEKKPEFSDTIKKAKMRVEQFAEKRLYTGQAAGPIFALKNFGWSDKQEQTITMDARVTEIRRTVVDPKNDSPHD